MLGFQGKKKSTTFGLQRKKVSSGFREKMFEYFLVFEFMYGFEEKKPDAIRVLYKKPFGFGEKMFFF